MHYQMLHRNGAWASTLYLFIGGLCSSAYTKQRVMASLDDLQKRLMQTCFDFEQDVIDATIDQWRDRLDG